MADERRLHPKLTLTDLEQPPFVPELSPVVDPRGGSLMTRPWLDWARRLTLLVGVIDTSGGGGTGTGDVVGPAGATPDAIAIYNGSTGKLIKDSLTSIGSVISQAVSQAIAAILPGGKLPVSNLPLHKTTHEPGGSDPLTNAAWTDQANVFTEVNTFQAQIVIDSPNPALFMYEADQPANLKKWEMVPLSQSLKFYVLNDAGASLSTPLTLSREGSAVVGNNLTATGSGGNVACKDQSNIFTAAAHNIEANGPRLRLVDTSQAANARVFEVIDQSQLFSIRSLNDALTVVQSVCSMTRSGDWQVGRDVFEKGRATPIGHWVNFTPTMAANAGTVTINTLYTARYSLVGKTMILAFYATITLSAAPSQLTLVIPGSMIALDIAASMVIDAAGFAGMAQSGAGSGTLTFFRNTAATGTFSSGTIGTTATFAIQ